jgi:hypothetical protein
MIDISETAELAWWAITGGNPISFPKKTEVELATRQLAAYWGKQQMFEKYKMENQWDSGEGYLLPFYQLLLVNYPADINCKKFDLLALVTPMDLPKGRGLAQVTYQRNNREEKIGKITQMQRLQGETTLAMKLISDYYYSWEGPSIIIRSQCPDDPVKIEFINVYPIVINSTNMDNGLQALIVSKLTERFRGYSPKDMIADQNPIVI